MIRFLAVTPERLMRACEELKQQNARVRAITQSLLYAVHGWDDCWQADDPRGQMQRSFVCQFTKLYDDMQSLHTDIQDHATALEACMLQWRQEWEAYHSTTRSLELTQWIE